jgi:hypothetical protein
MAREAINYTRRISGRRVSVVGGESEESVDPGANRCRHLSIIGVIFFSISILVIGVHLGKER